MLYFVLVLLHLLCSSQINEFFEFAKLERSLNSYKTAKLEVFGTEMWQAVVNTLEDFAGFISVQLEVPLQVEALFAFEVVELFDQEVELVVKRNNRDIYDGDLAVRNLA